MIEISLSTIILTCLCISLVACTSLTAYWLKHKATNICPTKGRRIGGTLLVAIPTAVVMTVATCILLPKATVAYPDRVKKTSYFIDRDFRDTPYFSTFVINKSGHPLMLKAVGYGSHQSINTHHFIAPGDRMKFGESIHGYDSYIPESIYSKNRGETHWYLISIDADIFSPSDEELENVY